jgi:hypothetical protein
MMPRILPRAALLALPLFAAPLAWLAFHPEPPRQNKPLFQGAQIDVPTRALFLRACQDCHSENTRWPWYSRLPPASWMISKDINEARHQVNFSAWESYRADERAEFLTRIGGMVRTGLMPLPRYTLLHRDAVLTEDDRRQIYEWSRAERKRLRTAAKASE